MENTFYRWLIGDMGTPGDYAYQTMHYYSIAAVAAAVILVLSIGHFCRTRQQQRRLVTAVAWFHLGFEILWRLIYLFVKGDPISCWWPLYPCNLGGILVPLFALLDKKWGKKMFYLFAFVGGVLTFAIPDGIFSTSVMVFPIVKSILQHTGLLMIPLLEWQSGAFRPKVRHMPWVLTGCLVHLLNSEVITRRLGFTGDYMFFRSGMPFVIDGIPQWITLSVFAVVVLLALSLVSQIASVIVTVFRKFRKS